MRNEFLAINKGRQGTISLAELQEAMVLVHGVSERDVTDIFKAMDANHDNEIHYSEFLAAMLSTRIDSTSAHVGNAFRNFDKDLSGYITADNLRDAFGNTFEDKQVESLLNEADFLGDGRISFSEFVAFVCDLPFEQAAFATHQESDVPYTPKCYKVPRSDKTQVLPKIYEASKDKVMPDKCCTLM